MPTVKQPTARKISKKQPHAAAVMAVATPAPVVVPSGSVRTTWLAMTQVAKTFRSKWADAYFKEFANHETNLAARPKLTDKEKTQATQTWRADFEKRWEAKEKEKFTDCHKAEIWFKAYFDHLAHVPWPPHTTITLMPYLSANPTELMGAILSCGYGLCDVQRLKAPPSDSLWSNLEFSSHWFSRARFALSFINQNTLTPYPFCKWLETSEKTTPSFVFGGLFSFLAAKAFLAAGGLSLLGYFHYGQYSESLLSSNKDFFVEYKPFRGSGKAPDYIALDDQSGVHLFEAKGGEEGYRIQAVKKGLAQLSVAPKYAHVQQWLGDHNRSILSSAVVFTHFESGSPLEVTFYDPPVPEDEAASNADKTLSLLPAVALAIARRDAHALFMTLPLPEKEWGGMVWRPLNGDHLGIAKATPLGETKDALRSYQEIRGLLPAYRLSDESNTTPLKKPVGKSAASKSRAAPQRDKVLSWLTIEIAKVRYVDRKGLPSLGFLSMELKVSRSTAKRALRKLVMSGDIVQLNDGGGYLLKGFNIDEPGEVGRDRKRPSRFDGSSWQDLVRRLIKASPHSVVVEAALGRAAFPNALLSEVAAELKLELLEKHRQSLDASRLKFLQKEYPDIKATAIQGGLIIATFPGGAVPDAVAA